MPSFLAWRSVWAFALVGSTVALAVSCSGSKSETSDKALVHNDFENLDGWLGVVPPTSLTTTKAHSGRYSIKVDANTEFSLSYNGTLGKMSDVRITKVKVDAWVFAQSADAGALLVTHIGDSPPRTTPMLWDGFDVVKASQKYGQWEHVTKEITIPAEANATTNFGVYLWRNKGNQTTYLDDLEITAIP